MEFLLENLSSWATSAITPEWLAEFAFHAILILLFSCILGWRPAGLPDPVGTIPGRGNNHKQRLLSLRAAPPSENHPAPERLVCAPTAVALTER